MYDALREKCIAQVKRLFRVDNEAIEVKYDLITEEELNATRSENSRGSMFGGGEGGNDVEGEIEVGNEEAAAVDEQDLFGALSDSDEETNERNNDVDIESEGDSTSMFESTGGAEGSRGMGESFSRFQIQCTRPLLSAA